jgi:DNA-binding transcriptional LysR family regulator
MAFPFVVGIEGTPGRLIFDRITAPFGAPPSLVETGSMILMRELLRISDHLGCISHLQIEAEIGLGALVRVSLDLTDTLRPIGLTRRADWLPTQAQAEFIEDLRAVGAEVSPAHGPSQNL